MEKNKYLVIAIKLLTFASLTSIAYSQKLPTVQRVSLKAPKDIRIDGKVDEWKGRFEAYNNATDIFYTMSNDENYIYLTVKTKYPAVIDKVIKGGITFTLNHAVSKKDAHAIKVIYPVLEENDRIAISNLMNSKFGIQRKKNVDSTSKDINELLQSKSKFIRVINLREKSDEKISLYNDIGLMAQSAFTDPLAYVFELAIPLKLVFQQSVDFKRFSYNIRIDPNSSNKIESQPTPTITSNSNLPPPPPPDPIYLVATDFWGEYTLAK